VSAGDRVSMNKAGLDRLFNMMTRTEAGKSWAAAALHPCGEHVGIQRGLPDTLTSAVATPDYRAESAISWDTSMFATAPTNPTTYSIEIISVGIPEIAFLYRLRDDASNTWSKTRVVRTPGFEPRAAVPTLPDTNRGTTLQGVGYSKARIVGKGLTFELNANAINNQGRVVSGQLNLETETVKPTPYGKQTATGSAELNATAQPVSGCELIFPNSEDFLVAQCPGVYQHEAIHGAYVVHKFDSPLTSYQMGDTGPYGDIAVTDGGTTVLDSGPASYLYGTYSNGARSGSGNYIVFTDDSRYKAPSDTTVQGISPFYPGTTTGTSAGECIHPWVSMPNGLTGSVTFFTGLVVGTATTGATVRVKTRMFLECLSSGFAGTAPFVHPSPLYDDQAITNVVKLAQVAPDAYPASYNGFGDILGSLWTGAQKVLNPISKVLDLPFIRSIPGVSTVNNLYKEVRDSGNYVGDLVHQATSY